jgi:hypothetical protein
MNRRNFILGLGTAATLSGAASVTGAALSNTVDATADFQVVATNELIVRKNEELTTGGSGSLESNNNYSDTDISAFDHENATSDPDPSPNLTVNQSTNGDLGMAFATVNGNDSDFNRNFSLGGTEPYNETRSGEVTSESGADSGRVAPLQIENNGGSSKDVAVEYVLGDDVNTGSLDDSAGIDALDVAQLFTFEINGTQISPPSDSADVTLSSGVLEIDAADVEFPLAAGEVEEVDFIINMNDQLEQLISNAASGGAYNFGASSNSGVSLLNEVRFGTNDN